MQGLPFIILMNNIYFKYLLVKTTRSTWPVKQRRIFMANFMKSNRIVSEGFDTLSLTKRSIFISNHVSQEDISVLNDLLPKHVIFAINDNENLSSHEHYKNRKIITYNFLKTDSLNKLKSTIESDIPILIFPEAKVSNTGSLVKIYDEICDLIIQTKATIHPIVIVGTENENYFPQPYTKVSLRYPFKFEEDETISYDKNKQQLNLQLINLFRTMRFNQTVKSNVNLFNELLETSKSLGEKAVIIEDPNTSMTYKDLLLAIYVFQNKLKPILKDQSIIGTFLPTAVGNVLTLFSLFKLGKTPALLNSSMSESSIIECIETANIKTILTSRTFIKLGGLESTLQRIQECCKVFFLEDIKSDISTSDKLKGVSEYTLSKKAEHGKNELILFTSGSENKPKGVILTHNNIYSNIHQALSVVDITSKDKILNAMPMFHSFGLTVGSILPLLTGTYVYLYPSPLHHKAIPEVAYQKEATVIFGTSTFFSMYGRNADPYDFRTMRLAVAGAEKLNSEVYQLWLDKFGVRICEGYGVTETAPILALNTPLTYKKGTVGQLLPGMDYRLEKVEGIEEGGNLFVKGPNVMKGYLIHDKGYVPLDEWHNCGDVVTVDDEGYISIISRLKRFAKIGGEMVSLNLVEDLATQFFGTRVIASVAIPDKRKGEKITLFTTSADFNLKEFKKFIKTNKQSNLLIPKELVLLEQIPLLGSGKTDYVTLQKLALSDDNK